MKDCQWWHVHSASPEACYGGATAYPDAFDLMCVTADDGIAVTIRKMDETPEDCPYRAPGTVVLRGVARP